RRHAQPPAPPRFPYTTLFRSWGLGELSTDHPIHGVDETGKPNPIRLSPSTVETAVQSPLQWFIYQVSTSASSAAAATGTFVHARSEEHTSELQSRFDLVCRLL